MAYTERENLMQNKTAVSGIVATTPRHVVNQKGLPITSFRLASNFEVMGEDNTPKSITNWFTVVSLKSLAINVATSISKGDRVIVVGTMLMRDWDNGDAMGTTVEIEADSVGHDLSFGTSVFVRNTYEKEQND